MAGFATKLAAFISLFLVQIMVALVYKFSQTNGKYNYSTISAITLAEIIKFCMSSYLTFLSTTSTVVTTLENTGFISKIRGTLASYISFVREQLSKQFLIHTFALAVLYCTNNQIAFILFQYVDIATVALFKSFTSFQTAIILYIFFQRPIHRIQWSSIVLQVIGLVIMQYDVCKKMPILDFRWYSILAISCTITSICTVWNEYLIKNYSVNLNVQNSSLYFFGTIINLCVYFYSSHYIESYSKGFFEGYTILAITVVFCNSILGIAITVVYKYGDAIIKTFSTACATGVLLFLNSNLFGLRTSLTAYLGAAVIFISSYIYFSIGQTMIKDSTVVTSLVQPMKDEISSKTDDANLESRDDPNNFKKYSKKLSRILLVTIILISMLLGGFYLFYKRIFIPLNYNVAFRESFSTKNPIINRIESYAQNHSVTIYGRYLCLDNKDNNDSLTILINSENCFPITYCSNRLVSCKFNKNDFQVSVDNKVNVTIIRSDHARKLNTSHVTRLKLENIRKTIV